MGEITLLNCDCMTYMKGCENNAFDLAIVDPPYGIDISNQSLGEGGGLYRAPKKYKRGNWDKNRPSKEYFNELRRIANQQIIWGGNYYGLPETPCYVVWDKNNGSSDFADCELAWTSFKSPVRLFKYTWSGFIQERMGVHKEIKIHPTQKPVALYKWLLKNYAEPGQRILDTHLGSGSSAIAAHYFGCDFVGCEIDKDYYDAMMKRFKRDTSQIAMFETFGVAK